MSWVTALRAHESVYRRAPSAHNTQPWTLDHRADEIRIGVDPARALPTSDPTGRDLELGLGAFVESGLIVAAGLGLAVDRAPGTPIRLVGADTVYPTPFTAAEVAARRVARGAYEPGPLDPAVLADLEPGLVAVPARDLAADLAAADRWMFGTPPVTTELRDWLRLSPHHPRYSQDGLTDRALELTRPEALFLRAALAAYPVTRRLGLAPLLAATGSGLLRYDGTVLVLTAGGDPDRVDAGRRLLRTWLGLARHGLAVHPLSQLIDCPATAARLADRVAGEPLAVFRVGRPRSEPPRSARLAPD
jgi:hypothetical protein